MAIGFEVKGEKLIITVDLSKKDVEKAVPSATGKTNLVASTRGSQKVGTFHNSDIQFALNVMAKPAKK